jgi:hypothetical protein
MEGREAAGESRPVSFWASGQVLSGAAGFCDGGGPPAPTRMDRCRHGVAAISSAKRRT